MVRFCGVIRKQRDQDDDGDTNDRDCNQEATDEQKTRIPICTVKKHNLFRMASKFYQNHLELSRIFVTLFG